MINKVILLAGRYGLYFYTPDLIKAEFSISETHIVKPLQKYFDLGNGLLGVGIPLLITGLIA
ncbi:hypothetical protein MUP00_05890 [Candidatus Bathyarchaeota archaeon]|nr:hypothetical protein [Candidatus Bathyarchaeota archaeon]